MRRKINPWLPWVDTKKLPSLPDDGSILVIIPTAGNDTERFKRCLHSLQIAAEKERIHIVIVVSPSTKEKEVCVKKVCGKYAATISLSGPFNYCRSINEGLARRHPKDRYALFLNDDVMFTKRGSLSLLKRTLREQRWACVGPFINYNPLRHDPTWPAEKSSLGIPRTRGVMRTNLPVSGSCALWDIQWLDRIGKLDEEFGRGWGMDEADLCLRALRLGARYGHQDAVAIDHAMHATFGTDFTRYTGPAHMRSLRYFKSKYGEDVDEWGRSHHWWPLPGVQVVVSACGREKQFVRCLESIERALDGFRWVLLIGDATNSKKIYTIAQHHCLARSSADAYKIKKFIGKKFTAAEVLVKMITASQSLWRPYPAVCAIDAREKLINVCVKELLWRMRDTGRYASKLDAIRITSEQLITHLKFTILSHVNKRGHYDTSDAIFHIQTMPTKQFIK